MVMLSSIVSNIFLAFVAFASRFYQHNFDLSALQTIFNAANSENAAESGIYTVYSNLNNIQTLLPAQLFAQKDRYDEVLDQLFNIIIDATIISFSMESRYDASITPANYLKKDRSYYGVLKDHWNRINPDIKRIWGSIQ